MNNYIQLQREADGYGPGGGLSIGHSNVAHSNGQITSVQTPPIKTMYNLEINETLHADMKWDIRYDITRVPGGWLYQPIVRPMYQKDTYLTPVFVPFTKE